MNAMTAAALDNAKTRVQIGWPLLLLAVATRTPAAATTWVLLLAVALTVRSLPALPGAKKPEPTPAPKSVKKLATPKKPRSAGRSTAAARSTAASTEQPVKVPRQRNAKGRWSK